MIASWFDDRPDAVQPLYIDDDPTQTLDIWRVHGDGHNVFGVPLRRTVEVAARTAAEARTEALKRFPDMSSLYGHRTSKESIL